jgi:hypothetical protein
MMMNMTVDPSDIDMQSMSMHGMYSEEPDTNFQKKKKYNLLKESVSKLSTDFRKDRQFIKNMISSTSKKVPYQSMSRSPFLRSIDNQTMGENDKTLPNIYSSRNAPIKSPVMESIRMSRQNQSKAFASLQKYRNGNSSNSNSSSDSRSS